ncbi:hypothetical protein lbkm_1931 [Lachnospiraceae bacterium KM106-2]|nr:hypothetical protein lbkm_1931 [Lachnospiraceae bacterium KM106-2]
MQRKQLSTRLLALGGIFSAFSIALLYVATTVPNMQIVAYGLASLLPACLIMEGSLKAGVVFYLETSILAFLLLPNKLYVLPYVLLFGHVGLWKWYMNNMKNKVLGFILRLVCLNIGAGLVFLTARSIIGSARFGGWVATLVLVEAFLVLYDYGFDLALAVYRKRILHSLGKF